jgi:hypothetical protein
MSLESRTKLTADRDEPREAPGLGRALLAVVLMIAITALVCALIYLVMIAIRPIEPRQYKKPAQADLPVLHTQPADVRRRA